MTPLWIVALSGLVFACAAYLAVQLGAAACSGIQPFDDGPPPGKPPVAWLIGAGALLGIASAARGVSMPHLGMIALVCVALVACFYCDVRCGIVPDYFTLLPIGIIVVAAAILGEWYVPLSMLAAAPFALAAIASKGRGMGWGDVKLIALGSAVVGFETALLALAVACMIAAAVAVMRHRQKEPIAFAPYIASAIGFALALPSF
jgi:prepilin signal peptidase PulO-like enzyme (type II secretory pathway)